MNVRPGRSTAGQNWFGTVWPRKWISIGGNSRSAPSTQAMYQSATDGDMIVELLKSPHTHTGLIWARPPVRRMTAPTANSSAMERSA